MQIYWLFVQVQRVQGNQEVVCVSPSCIHIAAFAALIRYRNCVQLVDSLCSKGVSHAQRGAQLRKTSKYGGGRECTSSAPSARAPKSESAKPFIQIRKTTDVPRPLYRTCTRSRSPLRKRVAVQLQRLRQHTGKNGPCSE